MSMFANPEYLNLARRFLAGAPARGQNVGRFPDMVGYSRTPAGQNAMAAVLRNMQSRRAQGKPRRQGQRPTPSNAGQRTAPYTRRDRGL